jgi:glycosyltransferase involved in cell wall biosynthesis
MGKNIPALIAIFQKFLNNSKDPYDLLLVGGDFWPDKTIDETIEQFHLETRVRKIGVVPDGELAGYYSGAIAFVTTSVSEGFCLPAVEAMASGCPVIAYDVGAIPEVIGEAGMLVVPNHEEHFVRCMSDMVNDPEKRTSYIEAGKKKAKQYNWTTFADKILHIIHADTK